MLKGIGEAERKAEEREQFVMEGVEIFGCDVSRIEDCGLGLFL